MTSLATSLSAGYACLAAWADLLDSINVYPVADGDTGTNLRITLAPFRDPECAGEAMPELLARCATGNSGNIAAAFFGEFCLADDLAALADKAEAGRKKAWQAIALPREGTMLDVFDSLVTGLRSEGNPTLQYTVLADGLQRAVEATSAQLPELHLAGVVDSGALAMYIFFDGFFNHLTGRAGNGRSILERFAGKLAISGSYQAAHTDCFCIDAIVQPAEPLAAVRKKIADLGESVVMVESDSRLKVHIHSKDPAQLRERLDAFGNVVHWAAAEIDQDRRRQRGGKEQQHSIHLVTDCAGSLSREMAAELGISLLDSYIIIGDTARPESLYNPEQIYPLMRAGQRITTAQASNFERRQHYLSLCQRFDCCLYLCVGSAFTGNYGAALDWKKDHDPDNRFHVMDTGAASGRLALIAILTGRQAEKGGSGSRIIDYAHRVISACTEYVFIDELKYLVAGGRISRTSGLFGDLLSMKPVVSPTAAGVQKQGLVRGRKGQLGFAVKRLAQRFSGSDAPVIMLQYSDNRQWVMDTVEPRIRTLLPRAEILQSPLSLTSGVHMGPGTWSIAFSPALTLS